MAWSTKILQTNSQSGATLAESALAMALIALLAIVPAQKMSASMEEGFSRAGFALFNPENPDPSLVIWGGGGQGTQIEGEEIAHQSDPNEPADVGSNPQPKAQQ